MNKSIFYYIHKARINIMLLSFRMHYKWILKVRSKNYSLLYQYVLGVVLRALDNEKIVICRKVTNYIFDFLNDNMEHIMPLKIKTPIQ